jgi:splicing factor 3B subunit 4
MRDETNSSKGYAFINFASFDASDAALEAMNGQYLCNRPITISYAFKKDSKGERHGTEAERFLAAQNPLPQADRPHQLFADAPSSGHTNSVGMQQQQAQMNPAMGPPPMMHGMMPGPPGMYPSPFGPGPSFQMPGPPLAFASMYAGGMPNPFAMTQFGHMPPPPPNAQFQMPPGFVPQPPPPPPQAQMLSGAPPPPPPPVPPPPPPTGMIPPPPPPGMHA